MIYEKKGISENIAKSRIDIRKVYSSELGKKELFNLLHDMGLFRVIRPEELVLRNKAIIKCQEIGLLDEVIVRRLIDIYFDLPLEEIERNEIKTNGFEMPEGDLYEHC